MLTLDNFHQYQWDGLAHCHLNRYSGLYYDAGLGKTAIGLTYLVQRLKHLSVSRRALVIAPIRVACQTWPNELAEWQHLAGTPYQLVRAEDDDPEVKAFHRDTYQRARQGGLQPDEVDTYVGLCRASLERQWEDFWTAGLSPIFAQPQVMMPNRPQQSEASQECHVGGEILELPSSGLERFAAEIGVVGSHPISECRENGDHSRRGRFHARPGSGPIDLDERRRPAPPGDDNRHGKLSKRSRRSRKE